MRILLYIIILVVMTLFSYNVGESVGTKIGQDIERQAMEAGVIR